MWVANAQAIEAGLIIPFEGHVMIPCALDARYITSGFNICPAGFQSCFSPISPFYAQFLPLEAFVFIVVYSLKFTFSLREDFGIKYLSNAGTVKTLGTLRD
jgi:hypothetical protein